jgi:hypothetical protein
MPLEGHFGHVCESTESVLFQTSALKVFGQITLWHSLWHIKKPHQLKSQLLCGS